MNPNSDTLPAHIEQHELTFTYMSDNGPSFCRIPLYIDKYTGLIILQPAQKAGEEDVPHES